MFHINTTTITIITIVAIRRHPSSRYHTNGAALELIMTPDTWEKWVLSKVRNDVAHKDWLP